MSLLNVTVAIRKAFSEWHREQAYAELLALDDRSLADIGLRRSDITAGMCGATHPVDATSEPQAESRRCPAVALSISRRSDRPQGESSPILPRQAVC
jgi:hypothetical protein